MKESQKARSIIYLAILISMTQLSSCSKWHEATYTRHEMQPRKREEFPIAYTQEELYLDEFEKYHTITQETATQKWIKKYPIIGITVNYYDSVDSVINKREFKHFFMDATLQYYTDLPLNLSLMTLKTIIDLYKSRTWSFWNESEEFFNKTEFNFQYAFE